MTRYDGGVVSRWSRHARVCAEGCEVVDKREAQTPVIETRRASGDARLGHTPHHANAATVNVAGRVSASVSQRSPVPDPVSGLLTQHHPSEDVGPQGADQLRGCGLSPPATAVHRTRWPPSSTRSSTRVPRAMPGRLTQSRTGYPWPSPGPTRLGACRPSPRPYPSVTSFKQDRWPARTVSRWSRHARGFETVAHPLWPGTGNASLPPRCSSGPAVRAWELRRGVLRWRRFAAGRGSRGR